MRWLIQHSRFPRLTGLADLTVSGRLSGFGLRRLVFPKWQPREDRHYYEPPVGELVVSYHCVTVIV